MTEATSGEKGLERKLSSWQQALIAVGGTIGVGLFLGSGATIGLAGPGVIVTYLVASIVPVALGLVLAEMASVHPVAGSFGVYAERYLGEWAGFVTRLSYWFAETFAIGAMVTAVGLYFGYWFAEIPAWIFMGLAGGVAVMLNALHVGQFGWLESLFSLVKVVAILAFILLGAVLILGLGERPGLGFGNLTADGGMFPNGVLGLGLALTLVVTTFLGVEAVAVTAGEARQPEKTVPRALLGLVGTLIVLYVLSMLVIVTVSPWRVISETSGTLTGSPFVKVFEQVGVPYAGSVMNFVVISAAFTGVVSHVYLATRMLFSLAGAGYVPRALERVDRRGVPIRALAGSTFGMILAVVLAARGREVFLPIYGTGVAALLSIWVVIFLAHLRFRRELPPDQLARLSLRVPAHPFLSLFAIGLILLALGTTPWIAGLRWTVPSFGIWLTVASCAYAVRRKRLQSGPSAFDTRAAERSG